MNSRHNSQNNNNNYHHNHIRKEREEDDEGGHHDHHQQPQGGAMINEATTTILAQHATLTYTQIKSFGKPQDPIKDLYEPIIYPALRNQEVWVIPSSSSTSSSEAATGDGTTTRASTTTTTTPPTMTPPHNKETVYLLRAPQRQQQQQQQQQPATIDKAYRLLKGKKSIKLSRNGYDDWGIVLKAMALHRVVVVQNNHHHHHHPNNHHHLVFREPSSPDDEEIQYVVIKKINKTRINEYLQNGGKEDPYQDLRIIQQYGDNIHIISCIEALEDSQYLYTIMPLCDGGTLIENFMTSTIDEEQQESSILHANTSATSNRMNNKEDRARNAFQQIMTNLYYLQSKGICHHDLSPDNIMYYRGQLLFIDFAMSLRVPHTCNNNSNNNNGASPQHQQSHHRLLLKPQGSFGKGEYMSPEVLLSTCPFDGYAHDLWSAACILYNLLTSHHLFHRAHPTDLFFKYFILAKGLSNQPLNERTIEILYQLQSSNDDGENDTESQCQCQHPLMIRSQSHLQMSYDVIDLLQHMLHYNPQYRYTLYQVMTCNWMKK